MTWRNLSAKVVLHRVKIRPTRQGQRPPGPDPSARLAARPRTTPRVPGSGCATTAANEADRRHGALLCWTRADSAQQAPPARPTSIRSIQGMPARRRALNASAAAILLGCPPRMSVLPLTATETLPVPGQHRWLEEQAAERASHRPHRAGVARSRRRCQQNAHVVLLRPVQRGSRSRLRVRTGPDRTPSLGPRGHPGRCGRAGGPSGARAAVTVPVALGTQVPSPPTGGRRRRSGPHDPRTVRLGAGTVGPRP